MNIRENIKNSGKIWRISNWRCYMSILDYANNELKEKYEKQSEEVGQAWKAAAKRMRELKQKELEEECENHRK